MKVKILFSVLLTLLFNFPISFADYPRPWQIKAQEPATPVMERFISFDAHVHIIAIVIVIFVFLLLLYTCIRFSKKNNPTPSKTSHNTIIEIVWTVLPVIILITIAIPSMRVLYYSDVVPEAEMTIKVVGHQWYWSYEYPEHGNFSYDSYIVPEDKLKPGDIRLLEVDNRVVIPANTNVKILITSADVIHSWAVPAFGVKTDAVPGRTNETWVNVTKPGVYYGQCSEICGINHAFMPIAVEVKTKEDFATWVSQAKTKFSFNQFTFINNLL